ncbi:lysylphosphatidylglycerol synthase domain-containing protein [Nonomuraea sp. LP-02]|uniref:lysylphosphatidylglycerol synthase domain-containing protein n=1 Tax=Nonomuraea sp. LP-02 TaxID=3097960 RepID=UPI002E366ADE|nr:lysylphosphatidylglycerol synthase domain-containing protein [Nonomuraea sp. LP-02]MED7927338.1 lysylphosphatidylglycerol synthase domain-containing protein [Nonomuraea sp. LP-02]
MLRRLLRIVLALIALGFLGYGLARNWDDTTTALAALSPWAVLGSFLAVMLGQFFMLIAWREIMAGLGTRVPLRIAGRIMFVGQLGKYIPGAVWAYAAMMDLGRDHGSPPRRTFATISLGLVINIGVAISIAAATLGSLEAVREAWYLVLLVPVIIVCLHPKVLGWGLNLALRLARREPLESVLPGRTVVVAVAWTVLGWFVYGVHIWLLTGRTDLYLAGTGAYAFAWATGILTVVVPAGVGIREGALVLVLGPVIGTAPALAVAIVSRLAFTLADAALAGVSFLLGRQARPVGSPSSAAVYADQNGSGSTALTPDRNLSGSPEA